MKNLILATLAIMLVACSADNKIIGKWQKVSNGDNYTNIETCTFSSNNTETCDEDFTINANGRSINIKYVITQEWHIKDGVISEKYLDARTQAITLNGENLLPTDPQYQSIAQILLSDKPNGKTFSRKIVFKGNVFELYEEDGKKSEFVKMN